MCEETFELASEYIQGCRWPGPIALACDDTKLHPALRTYWDATEKMNFLVGHTGPRLAVANAAELRTALEELNKDKATKVCQSIFSGNLIFKTSSLAMFVVYTNTAGQDTASYHCGARYSRKSQSAGALQVLQVLDHWAYGSRHPRSFICV